VRVELSNLVESDLDALLYRLRPELGDDARMALVGRYVILFRIVGEVVRIERVVYGGRDLLALFERE
jgi:toxin ParE1/3/4